MRVWRVLVSGALLSLAVLAGVAEAGPRAAPHTGKGHKPAKKPAHGKPGKGPRRGKPHKDASAEPPASAADAGAAEPPPPAAEPEPAKDAPPADTPPPRDRTTRGPGSADAFLGLSTAGGFGLGARGGYRFGPLYVGGTILYHFGSTDEGAGGVRTHAALLFLPGLEGGYELPVGPLILRPYAGLGPIFALVEVVGGGIAESRTDVGLALWPGVAAMYDLPETRWFLGGDARIMIATTGDAFALGLYAGGGARF